jgi:hypothetical protein
MVGTSLLLTAGVSFGAIAYSPATGRWGASSELTYPGAALNALGVCRSTDCRIVTWVNGGCASLATGNPISTWGTAYSLSRATADESALASCATRARGCRILAFVCAP